MKWLVCFLSFFPLLLWHTFSYAENINNMDKVYRDESHCLVAPEIRGKKDNPISCYCRDAIVDARYVYEKYLFTEKDRNLKGVYLTLVGHAQQMCGEQYDVLKASQTKEWLWNGPQVTREYPPEREIHKIQPDSNGFRTVEYKVRLTYIDAGGRVTKVENFTTKESYPAELDKLPSNTKK